MHAAKKLIIAIAIGAGVGFVYLLLTHAALAPDCGNQVIQQSASPSDKYVVVVFE
jgi:hypothetical protein